MLLITQRNVAETRQTENCVWQRTSIRDVRIKDRRLHYKRVEAPLRDQGLKKCVVELGGTNAEEGGLRR
jgi:hypothetical protein